MADLWDALGERISQVLKQRIDLKGFIRKDPAGPARPSAAVPATQPAGPYGASP